jgi:hypothetical protein
VIELEVNGSTEWIEPASWEALGQRIDRAIPSGHALCTLVVDGAERSRSELERLDLRGVRRVRVGTGRPSDLARGALAETLRFVDRLCDALARLAECCRAGREPVARGDLVEIADALHVLVPLLSGIRRNIDAPREVIARIEGPWADAERELASGAHELLAAYESEDPVALADASGFALCGALRRFRELLEVLEA